MKFKKSIMVITILSFFLICLGEAPLKADPIEKKKIETDKTKLKIKKPEEEHSALVDMGVDLVVSKVKITRGVFAGEHKIQIVPYIKNMCNGRTGTRIKVWLPHIAAEWIEGGIGPKEEKSAGALYLPDSADNPGAVSAFSVVVDNNNTINENNESNNTCSGITFGSSENLKIHSCPITGPHCRQRPHLKKYQLKDSEIRR